MLHLAFVIDVGLGSDCIYRLLWCGKGSSCRPSLYTGSHAAHIRPFNMKAIALDCLCMGALPYATWDSVDQIETSGKLAVAYWPMANFQTYPICFVSK